MSRLRTQYVKIILLSFDEKPIKEIQGRISSGSIPVNGNAAVRRTLNFQMIALENGEEINIHNKIKVEVGEERKGKITWYKQGIFIVFNKTSSVSTSGYKINITARDKMSQLDGTAGGTLPASVTFDVDGEGSKVPIPQIIREAVMHFGKEEDSNIFINDLDDRAKMLVKYIGDEPVYFNQDYSAFDYEYDEELGYTQKYSYGQDIGYRPMDLIYTGELTLKAGDTVADLLNKVNNYLGGNFEYFYDIDGKFIFQEKKNYIQTLSPLNELSEEDYVSTYNNQNYSYKFVNDEDIISINYNPKLSDLKNDFVVWGNKEGIDGSKTAVMYHLAIDSKPNINLAEQYFYQIKDKDTDLVLRYEGRYHGEPVLAENEALTLVGKPCQEWREELYRQALKESVANGEYSYYDKELLTFWRQIFDTMNEDYDNGWNPIVKNNPEQLNYWLDFIDDSSAIGKYSVNKIGRRTWIEENNDISYLYAKEIPSLIYLRPAEMDLADKWKNAGYQVFQVPERLQDDFTMSSTGASALDRIRQNLYQHLTFNASITITCLPKYNLEPNALVYVEDAASGLKGNYIITQFTVPLTYSGEMSITLTEAVSYDAKIKI